MSAARRSSSITEPSFLLGASGAKPNKKIVDRSSGKPEFVENALHRYSDGMVVSISSSRVSKRMRGR